MFRGSIVALVTPFTEEGEVDYLTLQELVEWHVEEGTDAIVCCGTTGEAPTLTHGEQGQVIKAVVDASRGRIPVIAGTGSYSTRQSVLNTEEAKALGAEGALVIVPYYNRPTPEGCLAHFCEIAKVDLPMIPYHHPGRTGLKLSAQALARICELPQVVGIKEASGDLDLALELKLLSDVPLLCGDDSLMLPMSALGCAGVISVIANIIPAEWKRFVECCIAGERELAMALYRKVAPLCKSLMREVNPQGVKFALSYLGRCRPHMRLPLLEPREETKQEIAAALLSCTVQDHFRC